MVDRFRGLGRRLCLGGVFLGGVFLASSSIAQVVPDDATCRGYGALSDKPALRLGRVADRAPRTDFIKDSDADKACPSPAAACRASAFLVPGDLVILGRTRGAFVCADYVGAKGQERAGWLPADAVSTDASAPPGVADWTGRWTREEATIVVTPGSKPGEIAVKGDATWGAKDPDRVRRGAVNIGDIEGTAAPADGDLAFTMGFADDKERTLPIDRGDAYDCRVWMKRLGPWLLVDDDNECGGMNVTFRGTYVRRR